MAPTSEDVTIREQLRPLYKKAATLCPFLEEFLVLPVAWSILSGIAQSYYYYTYNNSRVMQDSTRHTANMLLTQAYFPHLRQASFPLTMPSPWQPSPALCDYLSRLTHLRVIKTCSDFKSQALDVLLRCAKSLVMLTAPLVDVWSTKYLYNEEAVTEFRALVAARRGSASAKLAPELNKKLYLAVVRKYRAAVSSWARLPHRTQWMCRDLQVVDIGVELSSSARPADKAAVFQQLAHCCPLIVDLTIRSDGLHMGQWVRIPTMGIVLEDQSLLEAPAIRRRGQAVEDPSLRRDWSKMPEGYKYREKYVSSRAYNSVCALGGGHRYEEFDGGSGASWRDMSKLTKGKLTRLKRLCFVVQAVEGELSVRDFEFLRTKDDTRDRKHVKRASKEVYWPSLETFSLYCRTAGKLKVVPAPFDKIDSNDDRPFQKKLEGMRPGIVFQMTDAYTM
ncbi:hypothetical protein BGZ82_005694 [Podila clonocystis]|nr:hypothetical protein BGZ82_005694 [Podila clonocystis]